MPQAQNALKTAPEVFLYSKWCPQLQTLGQQYRNNQPFPHLFLSNFLDTSVAEGIAEEFPVPNGEDWIRYKHQNENKLGMSKRQLFPPRLGEVADELNSPEFVAWLSELTGISGLMADPSLEGGGLHQSGPGGFLNMHTDFSHHHYHKNWRRRINLILYLNPGWQEEWGGSIELWYRNMLNRAAQYPPLLNHALIFNTNEISFHGFPEPLTCPEGISRKSLAFYYYTLDREEKFTPRSTNYRPRPNDVMGKRVMIWLDKQAVDLYSRAKVRFGFSDEFASKVLGFFSRKK